MARVTGLRARAERARRAATPAWQKSLAPLLDVLFLLVIFLLVSANFDESRVLEVELPRAGTGEPAPKVNDSERRVITLFKDGSLLFNDTPTSPEELSRYLASLPEAEHLLPIRILGDASASLGAGLSLLDTLRQLGYLNCAFEVQRD